MLGIPGSENNLNYPLGGGGDGEGDDSIDIYSPLKRRAGEVIQKEDTARDPFTLVFEST
jgi:hypothetical protein